MSVSSLVTYQVKPGRMDDFLASIREAKEVIEGLAVNLQSIHAFRAAVAGANTGRVHVEFVYGDMSDWGETYVREMNDPDFNAMLSRATGPNSPAELIGRGLQAEIGPSAGSGTGSVIHAAVGTAKPGRMNDYLSLIDDINGKVLEHGAERVRHLMMTAAGPLTGYIVALTEYRDMAALGEVWVSETNDPTYGPLIESIIGPDGPIVPQSQAILTRLPLKRATC
ncbi:MAG: hypothetical protein R2849_05460 [Thermomicrobiales bacterium]